MSTHRPLPPFARMFPANTDPVTVVQGPRSFTIARELECIAVPPNQAADAFSWPMVRNRRVHLIESGEIDDDRVRATATALLLAGARHVRVTRRELIGLSYTAAYLPRRVCA